MDVTLAIEAAHAAPTRCPGQHVLILDCDLFHTVGGGQSAYRRLIALRPGDTFYYFRQDEAADAKRPANTVAIPYRQVWDAVPGGLPDSSVHLLWQYGAARNHAASVAAHLARRDFDVVDTPDYGQHGAFVRPAFAAEGIRVGTVALAMHGTISDAFRGGWPEGGRDGRQLAELRMREHLQFRAVDARYALSSAYAEHWQHFAPMPVNALDPLSLVGDGMPLLAAKRPGPPDLAFVGRREKWKGPDLFVDLAWFVPREAYRRLLLIGPDGPNRIGVGSDATLAAMARRRGLSPEIPGSLPQAEVHKLFGTRTLLLLPSRHDTFNLTALEALTRGCPALISERAGIAGWVRTRIPDLARLIVPLGCDRASAAAVAAALNDYDALRHEVVAAIGRAALQADPATVQAIYRPRGQVDEAARRMAVDLAARFDLLGTLRPARPESPSLTRQVRGWASTTKQSVRPLIPAPLLPLARRAAAGLRSVAALRHPRLAARDLLMQASGLAESAAAQAIRARRLPALQRSMASLPERSSRDVAEKIRLLSGTVATQRVDRARLFRELARLERRAGRDLIAATYALRVMRWLGTDRFGDLPAAAATLRAHGFAREAETAEAMFGGDAESRPERCAELMRDAFARNRGKTDSPLAVLDDGRPAQPAPRASVIVSLYNAADKLPTLLDNLAQQTLAASGLVEVVLVDSDSPADERGALEAWRNRRGAVLPIAYARSHGRETIQAAWNRGIRLARAPYLAFLGVDEGLHPEALTRLAAALDRDPRVDWAMADSLVTSVDRAGVFDADVMPYDRTGYRQDLVYLETCYLSWVGGLYRRSIHDRIGWYDESFRAAGDTEFKNRIMPYIRSVHVPGVLGVFNNYPEERTTQHPRAEIEDLRAWYLWRSEAGMAHAFANRPVEDAVALLRDCFGYRKSFCGHLSTDFDLADALARHIAARPDAPGFAGEAVKLTDAALAAIRTLELLPQEAMRRLPAALHVARTLRDFRNRRALRHAELLGLPATPVHDVFNDNRYEQHWWSWSG